MTADRDPFQQRTCCISSLLPDVWCYVWIYLWRKENKTESDGQPSPHPGNALFIGGTRVIFYFGGRARTRLHARWQTIYWRAVLNYRRLTSLSLLNPSQSAFALTRGMMMKWFRELSHLISHVRRVSGRTRRRGEKKPGEDLCGRARSPPVGTHIRDASTQIRGSRAATNPQSLHPAPRIHPFTLLFCPLGYS